FIAQFRASRVSAGQMRLDHLVSEDLEREYANDPQRARALRGLLEQEFAIRILHITDFFVEGREEVLLEQEASFRRAIDHAPACIFMADADDGRIFAANQVAEQMLGYPHGALEGRPVVELYPPAERVRAAALLRAAQEQGHASRDDLHLVAPGRPPLRVFVSTAPIAYAYPHCFHLISL